MPLKDGFWGQAGGLKLSILFLRVRSGLLRGTLAYLQEPSFKGILHPARGVMIEVSRLATKTTVLWPGSSYCTYAFLRIGNDKIVGLKPFPLGSLLDI
jgi:hypothetical protein